MMWRVGPVVALACGLLGCTPGIDAPPAAYLVQGDYDAIASCLYRRVEDVHGYGRDVHLTRLSDPPEIRVALSRESARGGVSQLAWEVEFRPAGAAATRMLVRQAAPPLRARPFWSSVLEPLIARCAGNGPVPA